ncbi:MAG: DUF1801 domain-containing protein [Cyanobacteria bacterium J06649_11]
MTLQIKTTERVEKKFQSYPPAVKPKLDRLRNIIISTASEIDSIISIEETLKWGEPSYLVKKGSTVRIDWKAKTPEQYAIYFKCTSKLVPTFKHKYADLFKYEKNRAILFSLDDELPVKELKACIQLALTYHKVKHLPNLGIG